MAQSGGGEVAVERAKDTAGDAGAGDEDGLSALPDEVLVLILLRLSTKEAARTSILARRWLSIWTLLPVLSFAPARDPHLLGDALSTSDVPLRDLLVAVPDASPQSLALWLPAAARRVSGAMLLTNSVGGGATGGEDEVEISQRGGIVELPCFEKATSIYLDLGFLGLSLPPAAVFAKLAELSLSGVWLHGPGELEDVVSSPRCPCLQKLVIRNFRVLGIIKIDSKSLQYLNFTNLRGVRQVTVVAPGLKYLWVFHCFIRDKVRAAVNISAPQLEKLMWVDTYDPNSVHLGSMEHLQKLHLLFHVYGPHGFLPNRACLMLLPRFKATIQYLSLSLFYLRGINNYQYLMEEMTTFPNAISLRLIVTARGHSFGACSFHVLKSCSGIKRLVFYSHHEFKEQTDCSSGCICDQPTNWKTEKLSLNHLEELEINQFGASEHELAFVKRLLDWGTVLKIMKVTFNDSITKSKAKELFEMFKSLSRPGVRIEFDMSKVLLRRCMHPNTKFTRLPR